MPLSFPVDFEAGEYRRGDVVLPGVDAVAMRDSGGKLWLALVNLDPGEAKDVSIDVAASAVRSAQGEVLTAPNVNSINTFDAPDTIRPEPIAGTVRAGRVTVRLPARSVAMVGLAE